MITDISNLQPIFENKLGKSLLQFQPGQLGICKIQITPQAQRETVTLLLENVKDTTLAAITGIDAGANIRLLYHLRTDNSIVTIETEVPKENAKIATITDIIPAANFNEREVTDLLGVTFEGHPSPGRLVFT